MGLFNFMRPTPSKLISQALPLYLEETERPMSSQAILLGSLSFGLNFSDQSLIAIVSARAITSGCIAAAHTTANHLSSQRFEVSETEYANFRNSILNITVGSIDQAKDARIKANKEKYLQIAREVDEGYRFDGREYLEALGFNPIGGMEKRHIGTLSRSLEAPWQVKQFTVRRSKNHAAIRN